LTACCTRWAIAGARWTAACTTTGRSH